MAKEKLKIAALMPIKKNSERVPNKSMKLFNGKPLYHAIINTLLKCSGLFFLYVRHFFLLISGFSFLITSVAPDIVKINLSE